MKIRNTIQERMMKSLGWLTKAIPGIFILGCFYWIPPVLGQTAISHDIASSSRFLAPDMVVATNTAFRAVEGELAVSFGDPPVNVAPFTWHSPAPGIVTCATEMKKCRYDLSYRQNTLQDSASTCKVGVLDVTVVNRGTAKMPVVVWLSWRHSYSFPQNPLGFGLGTENDYALEPASDEKKWNPMQTWFFLEDGFIRGSEIVYWISLFSGWERKTWVRFPETPYRDLTDRSLLGTMRFQRDLEPKGSATIQALIPHQPLPLAKRASLTLQK